MVYRARRFSAGLACVWLAATLTGCARSSAPSTDDLACGDCNLVLISIDTLRADHLGCYGYARETTPRIDGLAGQGVRFSRAYAASYHTADSHMSAFTALYPSVHGVRNTRNAGSAEPLAAGARTLAEQLRGAGLRTWGYHAGGNISPTYGFGRGFEEYVWTNSEIGPVLERLDRLAAGPPERFFLFFHTYRPHDPYLPDAPFAEMWARDYAGDVVSSQQQLEALLSEGDFAEKRRLFWDRVDPADPADLEKVIALYDGEIRQVDQEIGAILDRIDRLAQRTLVVLMSDHGEEFHEHGRFLHDQLYEEVLRVPLVLRHPDRRRAGTVVEAPVSLVDLAPTLLDVLGLPPLAGAQGRSLRPLIEEPRGNAARPIFAEKVVGVDEASGRVVGANRALVARGLKLLRLGSGETHLFDLDEDPREARDVSTGRPETLDALSAAIDRRSTENARLRQTLRSGAPPPPADLDDETVEQLRAPGYLQ
jgi:arylsulfatase A-like enzyme